MLDSELICALDVAVKGVAIVCDLPELLRKIDLFIVDLI
jgi:hypothetical protein